MEMEMELKNLVGYVEMAELHRIIITFHGKKYLIKPFEGLSGTTLKLYEMG